MDVSYDLLGNGRAALRFLAETRHPPRRLVLNAPARQRCADELREVAGKRRVPVEVWSREAAARLAQGAPEDGWILSVYFGHLLPPGLLAAFGGRAVNVHPSLLPWNRGVHTNVWPLVERTPAGVTVHRMTAAVDAGEVLSQQGVPIHPWDTAATLHARLEEAAAELLLSGWPALLEAWPGRAQEQGGSTHGLADLARLDAFSLDDHPDARRFFDLLRARTFPPHPGLRVIVDGEAVEARIELVQPAE